ncbi:hypothetical protein DSCO28_09270 [Desulfosarcina ovata subsp. sediminis]|uniref:DUF4194 domain-containing protein n=1 Tax=Desulfosarcina ovata subsp. sediminis TaxID=885957 RepID=A0A5K7ZHM9_9BACT|nr:DUF4194 domain-containing protein [Desulfosarcina ovata]BBO80361.1 hypothetical protein DSCO28_09270 [Desulfosarcina ovata subsp. sediminis]
MNTLDDNRAADTSPPLLPNLGPVVIRLMKGVVYRDEQETTWQDLMLLQSQVRDYVQVIGLTLVLDETDGYAYLHQGDADADGETLPRLMQRRPLSYPVSLLCVLLRKKLVEADVGGEEPRVVLTRDQMADMMRVFLKDQPNEARIVDRIDTYINKVAELGFLRRFKKDTGTFEVRRILKSLVDATWLIQLDEKLEAYLSHAAAD